jgi:hypothetical protein
VDLGKAQDLKQSMPSIVSGLIVCAIDPDKNVSRLALRMISELIAVLPESFESSLNSLFEILFDLITTDSELVSCILNEIRRKFDPNFVLRIVTKQSPTDVAVSFISSLCGDSRVILTDDDMVDTLINFCRDRDSKESRKILVSIGRQNPSKIQELKQSDWHLDEVLEEIANCDSTVPTFEACAVAQWCEGIKDLAMKTTGVEWEAIRLRLYQEISDGLSQTNEIQPLLRLINDLMVMKGPVLFNVFLRQLVSYAANRKFSEIVNEILRVISEGHGRLVVLNDLLKLAQETLKIPAVTLINDLVKKDDDCVTEPAFSDISSLLKEMINDEDVDCRRVAVSGFVCLYQKFGDAVMEECCIELTRPQVKLIDFYRKRE